MVTLFLFLVLVIVLLAVGLCFHLAGGIIKLVFKLAFALPCAILCGGFGVLLCCTLILIPLGMGCFKLAGWLLSPLNPV